MLSFWKVVQVAHAVIFGGSGFIGSHLAARLAARGERVVVADIVRPEILHAGAEFERVDVRAPPPDELEAGAETTIYLLAAIHRTPGHEPHEYFETNVAGAREIAAFAARRGARRIVFTSSIAVYGPGEDEKTEKTPPAPATDYGWSKLLAERALEDWARADADRRLIIARPAVVFGRGEDGNFTRLAKALSQHLFAYPGRRDTVKACCYVEHLVDSFDFALSADRRELLYNFAFPEPYDISEICEAFHEVGGLPRPIGAAPAAVLNLAARAFEALAKLGWETGVDRERIAKLTASTRVAPRTLCDLGYRFPTDLSGALAAWREDSGAFR